MSPEGRAVKRARGVARDASVRESGRTVSPARAPSKYARSGGRPAAAPEVEALAGRFPGKFLWGAATSDYQIEGAWDEDGKGPGIWDTFCRVPGAIANGDTGEIACDHYRRWREDVALMAELGLGAYRFAISWPRVLPAGTGSSNAVGLDFYDRLVDGLLASGIRPLATLYHWNLPQALQDAGGWGNHDVVSAFADYAGLVAGRLGDRVEDWITINEPWVAAFLGHLEGVHAPGLRDLGLALTVAHRLLLAHAAARDLHRAEAASDREEDRAAARRHDGYLNRWFLDPLFGRGYPRDLVQWYGDLVPAALVEEMAGFDGDLDFLGVNYYTRHVVRGRESPPVGAELVPPPADRSTATGWEINPQGLHDLLVRVARDYAPRRVFVTENGAALEDELEDPRRVDYLAGHVAAAADALEAGVPLGGYFVWSLLDNFEWAQGFGRRFGLVRVDYRTQRRAVRASGRWYAALIAEWRRRAASA